MTEQLVFDLAQSGPPAFENFVVGSNAELVATLDRMARGEGSDTGLVVWGPHGAGKSHLLQACIRRAIACGRSACYVASPADVPDTPMKQALVAVDDLQRADALAQARLFTLFNVLMESGCHFVGGADVPPARLPLREDLRTRLGWGLIFEALPLADADKAEALAAFARQRGFTLAPDVIAYLLAHGRRDMASLVAAIVTLDRRSLAARRPVTVPLLKEWLRA